MPTNDLSLAVELLNQGEFSKAEMICEDVVQATPDNANAWHLCGIARANRGDVDAAIECFEHAVKHAPNNANFHYNLALACRSTNRLDQAVSSYRDAIALDSNHVEARNNLGNALMHQGRSQEAIQCFRELLDDFPSSDAHYNLANLLQDTGHFDESIDHYKRALQLDPECSSARENLGRALTDADTLTRRTRYGKTGSRTIRTAQLPGICWHRPQEKTFQPVAMMRAYSKRSMTHSPRISMLNWLA